jgi:phosphoglycerate dehydrogenase-like enzyme
VLAWVHTEELLEALQPPPDDVEVAVMPEDPLAHPDLERVEFLVPSFDTDLLAQVLPRMTALKTIQVVSAGVDWIADVVPEGPTLCNAGDVRSAAVADWVMAALLFDAVGLGRAERQRAAHAWERWTMRELGGLRILVVGHGAIGAALAARLEPFDVRLTAVARRARPGVHPEEDLPGLLGDADAVVLLAPLTDATRGMVDAEFLAALPDGALVVNAGRGELVDTDALLDELRSERLRAALDVTDPEPLPEDHPLWDAPGLMLTPHRAGSTPQADQRMTALARAQLERVARGEPPWHAV